MEDVKRKIEKSVEDCKRKAVYAYLSGEESREDVYNEEILELEELSEFINGMIEHVKFLKTHECEFEDAYCIHCGLDGLA